jgi:hypothetical protein
MAPDNAGPQPQPSENVCRRAILALVDALASQGAAGDSILRTITDVHTMIDNLDRRLRQLEERRR